MAKTRVLVADDHAVLRAGLRLLINTQDDLETVGEAGSWAETIEAVRRLSPDVVTVDLSMPGGSGVKLIETLSRDFPRVRAIVLTMHDDPAYMRMALAAGAAGYVVKKSADTELLSAIRAASPNAADGPAELAEQLAATLGDRHVARDSLAELSEREREVFLHVARGLTNQAIADQLFLSVKTVESYRSRVMNKLSLRNRAEITRLAMELDLLDGNPKRPSSTDERRGDADDRRLD